MKVAIFGMLDRPATYYVTERLIAGGLDVAAVIIDPLVTSPKNQQIWHERTEGRLPMRSLEQLQVQLLTVDHRSDACADLIRERGIDLIVNAATPRILKTKVLSAPTIGALNVHPGRLPSYRGCTCVEWAILNDDVVSNTVHFMTTGIDEGPVVMREGYAFPRGSTYVDIRVTVLSRGYDLLAKAAAHVERSGMALADAEQQDTGTYYKPIPPDLMARVQQKILTGSYRYFE
jgi:methionyl-tRNA formyltransferase